METSTLQASDPPSSSASPASSVPLKIKEEPQERDDWPDSSSSRPNSVPTALVQPEPVQKHQRLRYYGRKHVASPDTAVCEVCQGEFRGPDVLQIHKLCHFNTSHVCYVCDCYFPNPEVLVLHMATNHRNLSTTTGNYKPEAERSFVCVICLQRFSSNKMLMKHQRCHSEKDSSYNGCKICALDFIGSKALLAHLSSPRHKEMKVKIQSIFVCVDCRSIFATRDSYAMHMMMRAQSETCDKMEDDDNEPDVPEQKVMDLIRSSVSESAIASSMAMSAMAANGFLLNSMMHSNGKRLADSTTYSVPTLTSSEATGIPLNLSTTLKPKRLECSSCYASFPTEDSLAMHKTMMHRHDNSSIRRNPTVSDLLRAQQQLQQAYLPMAHGFLPASAWTCVACGYDLDSCDALAMHMMEKHANQDDNIPMMSMPDPRLIQQKVQQVYAEAALQQQQNGSVHPHPHPQPTPSPALPGDMRSQSTGAIPDNQSKIADDTKLGKRRLSLQDEVVQKKAKMDKFAAVCLGCNQCFSNKEIFYGHIEKCSVNFHAHCNLCDNKFQSKDAFNEHLKNCQANVHACTLCSQVFQDQHLLLNHYRSDHLKLKGDAPQSRYECKRCHVFFDDLQSFMKHARSVHSTRNLDGRSTRDCPLCGWSTQDSQLYVQHMLLHNINLEELDLADGRPNGDLTNGGMMVHTKSHEDRDTRRNRRKPLASAKILPSAQSPDSNELNHMWSESGGSECSTPLPPPPPRSASVHSQRGTNGNGGIILNGAEDLSGEQLLGVLMDNVGMLAMCKHCKIIFTDRTMYHLHMGLHNRNHPWQCNLCGKACRDVHEFSSHVIHY